MAQVIVKKGLSGASAVNVSSLQFINSLSAPEQCIFLKYYLNYLFLV